MTRRIPIGRSLLLGLAVVLGSCTIFAQGSAAPTIKEIMKKVNGPTGVYFNLARELKADNPAWDEALLQTRSLVRHLGELPKIKPPQGDNASWDKLTRDYLARAQALDQAVQKRDRPAALAAHQQMGNPTCTNCHKAHRQ